jgi:hypothetical protein
MKTFFCLLLCAFAAASHAATTGLPERPIYNDEGFEELPRDEAIKAFEFLCRSMEANFVKLRTWRGECNDTIEWSSADFGGKMLKGDAAGTSKRRHEFVVDLKGDRLQSSYKAIGDSGPGLVSGTGRRITECTERREILLPERAISTRPGLLTKGVVQLGDLPLQSAEKIEITPRTARDVTFLGDIIDPRFYFSTTSDSLWEYYQRQIEFLNSEGETLEKALKVIHVGRREHEGRTLHRVYFTDLETGRVYSESFHDSNVGSNIVRMVEWPTEGDNVDTPSMWYEYSFTSIGDIFVPRSFRSVYGDRTYNRTLVFENQRLNEPVANNEFELAALKPKNGTYVVDELSKTVSSISNASLTHVGNFGEAPLSGASNGSAAWSPYLLALSTLVLCFIAYLIYRKYRPSSAS